MWLAHLMDKHDPQLVFFQAGVDGLKGDRWVQSEGKLEQGKGGKRDQSMDGSWEPLLCRARGERETKAWMVLGSHCSNAAD